MFDKIITVAMNPSLDVTLWIDTVDFDEPVRCDREKIYAGGKSLNVTRVLRNLGIEARLVCIAGEQNVKMMTTLLEQDGVSCRLIGTDGMVRENMSILFPDGRMLKINRKGTPVGEAGYRQLLDILNELTAGTGRKLVLFAGSLPPDLSKEDYKTLILQVKSRGAEIAIDSDVFSAADLEEIRPFLIKPNLCEARNLLGLGEAEQDTVIERMGAVSRYTEHILLSMGGSGMAYLHEGKAVRITVPHVEVKSTVGAGDTTLAGFICALQRGRTPLEAAVYASACGTASVTLEGTEAITPDMAERYLGRIMVMK